MMFRRVAFGSRVSLLEASVGARDARRIGKAMGALQDALPRAKAAEVVDAGPRLADLVGQLPPAARGVLAATVGACVERDADPGQCAGPVLDGLADALADAAGFPELWRASGGGELPVAGAVIPDEVFARPEGADDPRAASDALFAWWYLDLWETGAVAVLSDRGVRCALGPDRRSELVALADRAAGEDGRLAALRALLRVLDDEPLVVVHGETEHRVRMTGVADNFQLHTLLADVLVGGGHVPGDAPSAEAVAIARGADQDGEAPASAAVFAFAAADGTPIRYEDTPYTIPAPDGTRRLVLIPPTPRTWPEARLFPRVSADVVPED